jgi:hypothetical protein
VSTWREYGEDCPIGPPVHMDLCQPCPYFRGASSVSERCDEEGCEDPKHPEFLPVKWRINCNWPRNGSDLAVRESLDDMDAKHIELLVNR